MEGFIGTVNRERVRRAAHVPATFVDQVMMVMTKEDQVVDIGRSVAFPMDDVVGLTPPRRSIAARQDASAVPDGQRQEDLWTDRPLHATHVKRDGARPGDETVNATVARQSSSGLGRQRRTVVHASPGVRAAEQRLLGDLDDERRSLPTAGNVARVVRRAKIEEGIGHPLFVDPAGIVETVSTSEMFERRSNLGTALGIERALDTDHAIGSFREPQVATGAQHLGVGGVFHRIVECLPAFDLGAHLLRVGDRRLLNEGGAMGGKSGMFGDLGDLRGVGMRYVSEFWSQLQSLAEFELKSGLTRRDGSLIGDERGW